MKLLNFRLSIWTPDATGQQLVRMPDAPPFDDEQAAKRHIRFHGADDVEYYILRSIVVTTTDGEEEPDPQ